MWIIKNFTKIGDWFFSNFCDTFWSSIFTNFGDFFLDYVVKSPKFSLLFVNNFVPNLVTFFDRKNGKIFCNFLGTIIVNCSKFHLNWWLIFFQFWCPFLIIKFSPIFVTFCCCHFWYIIKVFTNFFELFTNLAVTW